MTPEGARCQTARQAGQQFRCTGSATKRRECRAELHIVDETLGHTVRVRRSIETTIAVIRPSGLWRSTRFIARPLLGLNSFPKIGLSSKRSLGFTFPLRGLFHECCKKSLSWMLRSVPPQPDAALFMACEVPHGPRRFGDEHHEASTIHVCGDRHRDLRCLSARHHLLDRRLSGSAPDEQSQLAAVIESTYGCGRVPFRLPPRCTAGIDDVVAPGTAALPHRLILVAHVEEGVGNRHDSRHRGTCCSALRGSPCRWG